MKNNIKNYNEFLLESKNMDVWDIAYDNTKLKRYYGESETLYLNTCKTCDDIVNFKRTNDRQIIGNVHQNIVICDQCSNSFVIDENQNYSWFQENKDKIIETNKDKSKTSFNILITDIEIDGNDNFKKYGEYYIYTEENTSDSKRLSHSFNEHYQFNDCYSIILEYPGMTLYSNSPQKSYWDDDVINVLNEFLSDNQIKPFDLF